MTVHLLQTLCRRRPLRTWLRALRPALFLGSLSLAWSGTDPSGARPGTPAPVEAGAAPSPSPASQADALVSTNLLRVEANAKNPSPVKDYQQQIATARQLRYSKDTAAASKMLVNLLQNELPAEFQRAALFELALVAQDEKLFPRAQQILAQYIHLFPQDPTVPEVLLRQGLIYRQMGANQMAIAKYYAVMNTALGLKLDQFDYYKRLVLLAQTEIADTYFVQGKFSEASDFYARILKQNALELNRSQIHSKLIRCLSSLGKHTEVVAQCRRFFEEQPAAAEVPELRFICATSLKQLGRNPEALGQVLKLLQSQQDTARSNPENWVYWQQRAGNDIANQLYLEGDYLNALEIYNHLAALNPNVAWQLPVWYQVGLIYERVRQPQKAAETFEAIVARAKELTGPLDTPSLKTVVDMAKWRKERISWQNRAELAVQSLHLGAAPASSTNAGQTGLP